MKYGYIITKGEELNLLTPFKRTSFEKLQGPDFIHSITKFENGLIVESIVSDGKVENYTNMQFVTKDGVNYELCNEFDQNK